MIKLEDISIHGLIRRAKYRCMYSDGSNPVVDLLKKNSIENYQQLKNLMQKGNFRLNNNLLREFLTTTEKDLKKSNKLGYEPVIYRTNGYGDLDVDGDVLKSTEQEVLCIELIKKPTRIYTVKDSVIAPYSIYEVKQLLNHVVVSQTKEYGENALKHYLRRYGNNECLRVRDTINFYEEQIVRQVRDSKIREGNLFTINKEEKTEIVTEQLKEIVKYLTDSATICVWGELTDVQKKKFLSAIYGTMKEDRVTRNNLINIISNYTTLKELEKGIVKTKTLDRFIVK